MVLRILKKANTTCSAFRPKLQRPNDTANEFRIVVSSDRRMGQKVNDNSHATCACII
ncbi:hypothetical protein TNCT_24801, partial [Trichonephila clavata]